MPAHDWIAWLHANVSRVPVGQGHVEVIGWSEMERLPDNEPHRHTFFEACLVGPYGEGVFHDQGHVYRLEPGMLFLARPGAIHCIKNKSDDLMFLSWWCFTWSDEGKTTSGDLAMREFCRSSRVVFPRADQATALWSALRSCAKAPRSGSREQARHIASALLLSLAQSLSDLEVSPQAGRDPSLRAARTALRYIEDNLNRPLLVEEIARHVSLSERHLTRLVRQLTGVSPTEYILTARLDRARALLLGTRDPIKAVSVQVGYADPAYFARLFTKRIGMPPSQFRDQGPLGDIVHAHGALV